MGKKIFFIWGGFPPDTGGAAIRLSRVIEYLKKKYKIVIFVPGIKGSPIYEKDNDFILIRIPPKQIFIEGSTHKIYNLFIMIYNLSLVFFRLILLFGLFLYFYFKYKPDLIIKEANTWDFRALEKIIPLISYYKLISPWNILGKIAKVKYVIYFTNLWSFQYCHSYLISQIFGTKKIIIVDRWMESSLRENLSLKTPISYIPCCIDTLQFQPGILKFSDRKSILFVGRLAHDHGCDELIKSMTYVVEEKHDALLIIAGSGKNELSYRNLVTELHIEKNVTFLGKIKPDIINKIYCDPRLFVNPLREPGIGNVTLEALASGLPVIKSHIWNLNSEPIIDGYNGFLYKSNDPRDLSMKILKILNMDEDSWIKMSLNARSSAERYNCNNIIKEWCDEIDYIMM
jgi:glycosyltransferase involved in cell wall biosynthesis